MSETPDHPESPRRGDLVITDDSYYGIVLKVYPGYFTIFCSNGVRVNYPRGRVAWLPVRTVGEFTNPAHANFLDVLRLDDDD